MPRILALQVLVSVILLSAVHVHPFAPAVRPLLRNHARAFPASPPTTPALLNSQKDFRPALTSLTSLNFEKGDGEDGEGENGEDNPGEEGGVKERILVLFNRSKNLFERWKIPALSFFAGVVMTVGSIFLPIFGPGGEAEKFTEPVTLFSSILTDLDRTYVDPVDTKKVRRNEGERRSEATSWICVNIYIDAAITVTLVAAL